MELLPDSVCALCDQKTPVLHSEALKPYAKYIGKTFFDNNRQGLTEFQKQAANQSLCVLCTHKVVVSHKFKDGYEEVVKKRTAFKKSRGSCFLCDRKTGELVLTDDDPNDFLAQIKVFMASNLLPRPYMQCVTCFDCLFYLNIWFELHSSLIKKLKLEDVLAQLLEESSPSHKALRKLHSDDLNQTPSPKTNALKKDKEKENVTPPSENEASRSFKRIHTESESSVATPPRKVSRLSLQGGSNKVDKIVSNGVNVKSRHKLNFLLKNTLKHLRTIKETKNMVHYPANILNDRKMFSEIPYVIVIRNIEGNIDAIKKVQDIKGKVNNKKKTQDHSFEIRENNINTSRLRSRRVKTRIIRKSNRLVTKESEVIELSDDDSDELENDTSKQSNEREEKNNEKGRVLQTTPFKIKLSKNFVFSSTPKSIKKKSNVPPKKRKYSCDVCDTEYSILCDYKQHKLWHEKPEAPKVNVIRHQLPEHIKASEFPNVRKKSKENVRNRVDVSRIVQKYTGETDIFDDTDFSQPKEIENIIDDLDSSSANKDESSENRRRVQGPESEGSEIQENSVEDKRATNKSDNEDESENNENEEDSENKSDADKLKDRETVDKSKSISDNEDDENNKEKETEPEENNDKAKSADISVETGAKDHEAEGTFDCISIDDTDSDRTSIGEQDRAGGKEGGKEKGTSDKPDIEEENREEGNIEKMLAEIHGQSDTEDESEFNDSKSDCDDNHSEDGDKQSSGGKKSTNKQSEEGAEKSKDDDKQSEGVDEQSEDDDKQSEDADKQSANGANNENESFHSADSQSDDHTNAENDENGSDEEDSGRFKRKRKQSSDDDEDDEKSCSDADNTPKTKRVRFAMDYQGPKEADHAADVVVNSSVTKENAPELTDDED